MTLAQVKTMIGLNLSRNDREEMIIHLLDIGLEEIQARVLIRKLITTTSVTVGTNDYTFQLPHTPETDEFVQISLVNGVTSRVIEVIPYKRFRTLYPEPTELTSGTPAVATEVAGTVTFIPPANAEFVFKVIRTTKLATPATEDGEWDVPGIDNLLVAYTTWQVWLSLGNAVQSSLWGQEWERRLATFIKKNMATPGIDFVAEQSSPSLTPSAAPWYDPFTGYRSY